MYNLQFPVKFGQNIHWYIQNKRVSANPFILNTFLVVASNATRYANALIVELDKSKSDTQ